MSLHFRPVNPPSDLPSEGTVLAGICCFLYCLGLAAGAVWLASLFVGSVWPALTGA